MFCICVFNALSLFVFLSPDMYEAVILAYYAIKPYFLYHRCHELSYSGSYSIFFLFYFVICAYCSA